jgi:hypothetical protein
MRLDLSGPRQRLDWAEHHLIELKGVIRDAINTASERGEFVFHHRFDSQTSCFVLMVEDAPRMPAEVGPRIGDVLHNLRSTLDHLAWVLVRAGHTPNPADEEKVAFPICDTSRDFKGKRRTALPGVRGDQRAIIRLAQPYQTGRYSEMGGALRFVRDYNNRDKHRITHPHYLVPRELELNIQAINCTTGQMFPVLGPPPRLEPDNEIMFIPVTAILGPDHHVEIEGVITPVVGFEDGTGVLDQLENAHTGIGLLINAFDRDWP